MTGETATCRRCVMDTSARDIRFDAEGNCNYCTDFLKTSRQLLKRPAAETRDGLEQLVRQIKADGKTKQYDCIVGVSGGLDSSWTLVQAKALGLRPLAVHMDNGWNSELAQHNIESLIKRLDVDLYTHVIDWREYRGLMQAFFDADVVDVELLYDNAMLAVNYQQALQHGVKHILAGTNQSTEGLLMPKSWNWFKFDARNIRAISRAFNGPRIDTFPAIGAFQHFIYQSVRRYRWISFLDLLDYRKADAIDGLVAGFGYKPYPYKHYESVFTRFYQGFLLPTKFGIDKRRVHFSTLICTEQMSREQALSELAHSPYPSQDDLDRDTTYFLKKMGWSPEDLQRYLDRPERSHSEFPSERVIWEKFARAYSALLAAARRNAGQSH